MSVILACLTLFGMLVTLLALNAYLERKSLSKAKGYEDQQRYYDKHHKHNWNTSKIKVNKDL